MRKIILVLLFFTIVTCTQSANGACNRTALSDIDAVVHKTRNSRVIKLKNANFNLLDKHLTVDVTQANVTELCKGMIKNFDMLESLSLINVNLSIIESEAFQNLPKLRHLALSVNHLVEVKSGVFNELRMLQVIYLSNNEIRVVEQSAFANMPELKAVHLDKNHITELSGNLFNGCPKISLINFSSNLINALDKFSLRDLHPKHDKNIDVFFKNNFIGTVQPDTFETLNNPLNLHLESNQITLIADIFFNLKENSVLFLNENNITCVSDDVIIAMRNTSKSLYVLKNPVECSCVDRVENLLGYEIYGRGEIRVESTVFPCNYFGPE